MHAIDKKLLVCAAAVGGIVGTVKYLDKHSLSVIGNLTMHIPVKLPFDFRDIFTAGLGIAEDLTK